MGLKQIVFIVLNIGVVYANITGKVFIDLPINGNSINNYGFKDSNEIGVKNVIVKVFDENNTEVDSAITDKNGAYILKTEANKKYRIEFSNYPTYLKESMGAKSSSNSIQFANDGAIVDYALEYPNDYTSTANPDIASVIHINGAPIGDYTTLASFSYNDSGLSNDGVNSNLTTLATNNQVGSTWGLAYAKKTKTLYSAAFLKRHVGLIGDASDNLGKIWKTDLKNNSTELFVIIPNAGEIGTNEERGITGGKSDPSHDDDAFLQVGKIGLGDLDISEDEKYLYTINLNDKKLYRVTIDSDNNPSTLPDASTDIKSYLIPDPGCNNGEWRPFALKVYHGFVYVGGVCSAENGGSKSDMKAFIYKFDGSNFNEEIHFSLDYNKSSLYSENYDVNDKVSQWLPWTNSDSSNYYSQPMLTDIEFDVNGDMIISFTDRYGHQIGHKNYIYKSNDVHSEAIAGGDILRACLDENGVYILENKGVCGGVTGAGYIHTLSGPGGGEFYNDRFNKNSDTQGHAETSDGAVALLAGSGEIILNSMDPVDWDGSGDDQEYFRAGGPAWYYNSGDKAGSKRKGLQLYKDRDYNAVGFAKGTGVGDIELLTEPAPIEIGNYVWYDENRNGIQDANENGIEGVKLTLHEGNDCSANEVGSVNTDENGNYYFGGSSNLNMSSGNILKYNTQYSLCIALNQDALIDKMLTQYNNTKDNIDSDGIEDGNENAVIIFTTGDAGENNHSYDFGFKSVKGCLGDYVWYDKNANGIQDDGEKGVEGVKVYLLNSDGSVDKTNFAITDKNGKYEICNLEPGNYGVQFDLNSLPAGYVATLYKEGDDDKVDSDANRSDGKTKIVTLAKGDENNNLDMGIYKPICLGDFVWEDKNYNGLEDDGSNSGIDGVKVELLYSDNSVAKDNNDNEVTPYETNKTGKYKFCNLKPGVDYRIKFTPKSDENFKVTIQNVDSNSNDNNDSDIDSNNTIEVKSPLEDNLTLDAGFFRTACIGDLVWEDKNANGIFEDDENGIERAVVHLMDKNGANVIDADGNNVADITTINDGKYKFCNLYPGDYKIRITPPDDYEFSPKNQGTDITKDSDIDIESFESNIETLESGEENLTIDAGVYKKVCIGDFVWEDANVDGIQNDGINSGLEGIRINLLDGDNNDTQLASVDTNQSGEYRFCNLIPGKNYKIEIIKPDNKEITQKGAGDKESDNDINSSSLKSDLIYTESGVDNYTIDAGLYTPVCLGDYIWNDINANGIQDSEEVGINGIKVELLKDNILIAESLSENKNNQDGFYEFCNLKPNTAYIVKIIPPAGYYISPKEQELNKSKDSNINIENNESDSIILEDGKNDYSIDAGLYQSACIGDKVWLDKNANGIQDAGESGVAGVKVEILNEDNTTAVKLDGSLAEYNITANDNGVYHICGLKPAKYRVKFSNIPQGYYATYKDINNNTKDANDSDANSSNSFITSLTELVGGEDDRTWDLGLFKPACIGDKIWEDVNGNGLQDTGERGVVGAKAILLDENEQNVTEDVDGNLIAPIDIDSTGKYEFCKLRPAKYKIKVVLPKDEKWYFTDKDVDNNTKDANDSDVDVNSGVSVVEELSSGENNDTIDAGAYKEACIGNFVWLDKNANGIQDDGNGSGEANVTLTIYNENGVEVAMGANREAYSATIETNSTGLYKFCNLKPGVYQVKVTKLPEGYYLTKNDVNNNSKDNIDSDVDVSDSWNRVSGEMPEEFLSSGENNLTFDAGVFKPACIGDFTFKDENADGIYEPTIDTALSDVNVTLLDNNGNSVKDINANVVASKTTDINGKYEFCNLMPGEYKVKFAKEPDNNGPFISTKQDVNNNSLDANDSDIESFKITTNGLITPEAVILRSGDDNKTIDAGFIQEICLGDFVWDDRNANGIYEDGEEPIKSVKVELFYGDGVTPAKDVKGNLVKYVETNSSGNYKFCHLKPAINYVIKFTKPDGMYVTFKNKGNDKLKDSDINSENTIKVTKPVKDDMSLDAGFFIPACIGDFVWEDKNANGIQDNGESGVSGVKVTIVDKDGNYVKDVNGNEIKTIITSDDGLYHQCNLVPDDYKIKVEAPNGYYITRKDIDNNSKDTKDSDVSPTFNAKKGVSDVTTLDSGEDDRTWDVGLFKTACIGDFVWEDKNANGIQDADESGVAKVALSLVDANGSSVVDVNGNEVKEFVTSDDGKYKFCNLVPGEYQVKVNKLPQGYYLTKNDLSNNSKDNVDSDVIVNNWHTNSGKMPKEFLSSGENNLTFDAGVYQPACLNSKVWFDDNVNGIYDEGESPIEGAEVSILIKSNDKYVLVKDIYGNNAKSVTDSNGDYRVCNLLPGKEYYVSFYKAPDSDGTPYFTSKDNGDENSSGIKEFIANGGTTPIPVVLKSGESKEKILPLTRDLCIGDSIWYDKNLNGIQDEDLSKYGVSNINVHIYDMNGNVAKDVYGNDIKAIKTNSEGKYRFCHLAPGQDYKLKFDIPDSYHPTKKIDVNDSSINSDNDNEDEAIITVKAEDLMKTVVPTTDNGISTIINPNYDLGIYCDCDDYKVHPQDYKELKANAFSIVSALLLLLTIFSLTRKERN